MTSAEEKEFHAIRDTGCGGSDIASVLNVGYGCALRLYRQKTGETPDYPRKETGAMELGKLLEPWIAQKFAERHGAEVIEVAVKRDEAHPHRLVHADRLVRYRSDQAWRVLEIKALGSRVFLDMKREGLSIDYMLQLTWGMARWDAHMGTFAVANRDTGEILDWDHARDDELCELIDARVDEFWANVQAGSAPGRLDPEDRRCQTCEFRRTCQGAALIHVDPKAKIEQDESMRPLLVEYSERKKIFEEAEESLEIQKALIKDAMGDRVKVAVGESKISYGQSIPHRYDVGDMGAAISRLAGKVDYDGTFLPMPPVFIETNFKKAGAPFRSLRIYE